MMNRKTSAILLSTFIAVSAHAANPDPKVIDFPKNKQIAAEITLSKGDGSMTLEDGHPLRLRFDEVAGATPKTVACQLKVSKKVGQVALGEAAVVGIQCSELIELPREKLGFKLIDGDEDIGTGAFRP